MLSSLEISSNDKFFGVEMVFTMQVTASQCKGN